jgi:hypothetical protein
MHKYDMLNGDAEYEIAYKNPSLLGKAVGDRPYGLTSKAVDLVLPKDKYQEFEKALASTNDKQEKIKLLWQYKNKTVRGKGIKSYRETNLMEPKPILIGKERWNDLTHSPRLYAHVDTEENYNPLAYGIYRDKALGYGKMKADYKELKKEKGGK